MYPEMIDNGHTLTLFHPSHVHTVPTVYISGGKAGRPFGGRLSLSSMKGRPGLGSETSLTGRIAPRVLHGFIQIYVSLG